MPEYYPAFLNIEGRPCVVIGGGAVAEQKVKGLLHAGASVTIVSPDLTPALQELATKRKVTLHQRQFKPGDLARQFLAIAATDDTSVNQAVFKEANERHMLVNVVDVPKLCSYIAPAVVRRGDITFAVSTGGRSPAMARKVREDLERFFPEEYGHLLSIVSDIRAELKDTGEKFGPEQWNKVLSGKALGMVRDGQVTQARQHILTSLRHANGKVRS